MVTQSSHEELQRAVGRIEGKLDLLIDANTATLSRCGLCTTRFEKIENKLQTHQTFFWGLGGFITLIGFEKLGKYIGINF